MTDLNDKTDKLNEILERIEEALIQKNYGISAYVPLGKDSPIYLAFTRRGSSWGLYMMYSVDNFAPLKSTARTTRVAAVNLLPKLKQVLEEEQLKAHGEVQAAIEAATVFLETL